MWAGSTLAHVVAVRRARAARGPAEELLVRRRLRPLLLAEHLSMVVLVATGALLMRLLGWNLGHPGWLGLKLGLTAFLLLPLEAMHAYISWVWIARGLNQTQAPPFSKDLSRGVGVEEMVRTLELVLLVPGVALMLWLSLARPF